MDPESKLFYRKLIDFGSGVGFREGQRKFEEEMRIEDEVRSNLNQDVAMNPNQRFLNNYIKDKKIASHHFFDFPEDGERINGMILGVPRKDIPETKYYDDDDIMDFNKLPIDLV